MYCSKCISLNPLSNSVTFTAIVPVATPYGGVKCNGVGKSCDFRPISRYSSLTVEDRCVHAAMRLTRIEFSFDPCNIYRDVPRGVGYLADARSVGDSHPSCSRNAQCVDDGSTRQFIARQQRYRLSTRPAKVHRQQVRPPCV